MELLSREGIFKQLEEIYTGSPSERDDTIREYWNLSPDRGLKKSMSYMRRAKGGRENAGSDSAYWSYEGDVALASCLIAIFKHLRRGKKEFPPIPVSESGFLMDRQGDLILWAKNLVSDHVHHYEACTHKSMSKGSHLKCKVGKIDYGGLLHDVCSKCGDDQWDNPFESL